MTTTQIGAGTAFPTLGSFPWEALQPGDVAQIVGKDSPYYEFLPLTASGTPTAPITIEGIPGPNGEPVVLSGNGATIRNVPGSYLWSTQMQIRGLVTVTRNRSAPYGVIPSNIVIANLTIRNAHPKYSFPPATGYFSAPMNFSTSAAGIYIERGQNIVIENCNISACADGLFVASDSELTTTGAPAGLSQNITVSGCTIRGNGVVNSDRQHEVYVECNGITFDSCIVGPLVAGALGSCIKDRSAGSVIRRCTLTGGGHAIDSCEPQESRAVILSINPNAYAKRLVDSCLILNGPGMSTMPVFYGFDSIPANAPNGTLEITNTTLVNQADQVANVSGQPGYRWRTIVFEVSDNGETIWVGNCTFINRPATPGKTATLLEFMDRYGNLTMNPSFASPGWLLSRGNESNPVAAWYTGAANGMASILPAVVAP